MKSLIIGCDNAAVSFKNEIVNYLRKKGFNVTDVGVNELSDSTYYPNVAERVCGKVIENADQFKGILICGTGIGMAISANKHKGIRAAVCHDIYSAQRSVLSNDCNVMCMGARVIGLELAKVLVDQWVNLDFQEGPSSPKVDEMIKIESQYFK